MKVKFQKLHPEAVLPTYAKPGDAGLDMTAVEVTGFTETQVTYSFGLGVEIPEGYVGLIFPRSSIRKYDLSLSNCVGVIDSGYRGCISATFNVTDKETVAANTYQPLDRIAQMIIMPYPEVQTEWANELTKTVRGDGGFGSTGA